MKIGLGLAATFLVIVLLQLAPNPAVALKCFNCEGDYCKEADIGDAKPCRPGFDVCMKVLSGTKRVERVCGTLDACGYGASENWARRLVRHLKNVMGSTQKRSLWEQEEYEKRDETFCCDTDFCNSSQKIRPFHPVFYASQVLLMIYWKM